MKPQLLFVFTGPMQLGGIERSLLGLLDAIDYDRVDVDLFLYSHHGVLFPKINSNVNLLPEIKELAYLRESIFTKLKHGCLDAALMRLKDELTGMVRPINRDATWAHIMRRHAKPLEKQYDLAIGYFRPFDFIVERVNAKRKTGWVHTDYRKVGENLDHVLKDYERLDSIAVVSKEVGESFGDLFPQLKSRLILIENILSVSTIRQQANAFDPSREMSGTVKLLSIGRFSHEKNFDNVPEICRMIIDSGLNVIWYLIGYGPDEALIRQRIIDAGMQDHVIILGEKENPYPYIKACDLYVQPSRYEGKSVCVLEAQVLCKPVVITNYGTCGSQLKDGIDGMIVPMDNEGCAKGIVAVLRDPQRMKKMEDNCSQNDYSNAEEVSKVYRLLEC